MLMKMRVSLKPHSNSPTQYSNCEVVAKIFVLGQKYNSITYFDKIFLKDHVIIAIIHYIFETVKYIDVTSVIVFLLYTSKFYYYYYYYYHESSLNIIVNESMTTTQWWIKQMYQNDIFINNKLYFLSCNSRKIS